MRLNWNPFKKISPTIKPLNEQIAHALKSLSLPEATPHWYLFSKLHEEWDSKVAIKEGYNASSIVYAAVEKRAKLLASVPWRAMQIRGEDWEHQPNSELQNLINNPNPEQSWYELIYEVSQSLDLSGNAFISEIKEGRKTPFQLWLLPAYWMRIKPGKISLVDYYEYEEGGIRKRIEPADMIQLKMPNPNSRWFGMPILMAAGRPTDIDRESGIWQKVSLQNRGVIDVHIEIPEGTTKEQIDGIRDRWKQRQSGPANARDPIISSGKINQMGHSAVEMDFIESRKAIWTEIAAVFGVPLAALGFTENVNLANAKEMKKIMWQDTIIPQLELIKRQLNQQLAIEFGPDWKLEPDLSNVEALQEDFDQKLSNADKLWRMGVPFNIINQRLELGFDDIAGGEVGYLPSGLLPSNFDFDDTQESADVIKLAEMAYGKAHRGS